MKRTRPSSERIHPFAFPSAPAIDRGFRGHFFRAEGGEICVPLGNRWEELLGELEGLGPVALITHNSHVRLAALTAAPEFAPEPGSTSYTELRSGLHVESADWAYALAVQEEVILGTIFGFQFFDHHGKGQLKILLSREAQIEHFLWMLRRHGVGGYPPDPEAEVPGCGPSNPVMPDREALRALWPITRHEIGGHFFPGLPGVTRLAAVQAVGEPYARQVGFEAVLAWILQLRRKGMLMRFSLYSRRLTHAATLAPHRVERCPQGLHLFDQENELHFLRGEELLYWVIRAGGHDALEVIDASGRRIGLISCGEPSEAPLWDRWLEAV